jgi:hypothetical protein
MFFSFQPALAYNVKALFFMENIIQTVEFLSF